MPCSEDREVYSKRMCTIPCKGSDETVSGSGSLSRFSQRAAAESISSFAVLLEKRIQVAS